MAIYLKQQLNLNAILAFSRVIIDLYFQFFLVSFLLFIFLKMFSFSLVFFVSVSLISIMWKAYGGCKIEGKLIYHSELNITVKTFFLKQLTHSLVLFCFFELIFFYI